MYHALKLDGVEPLFVGGAREIYRHPSDPDLLIKFPHKARRRKTLAQSKWKRRFRPYLGDAVNLRELRESVRLSHGGVPIHLSAVAGMVLTDIGWGLVVRMERDADGSTASTLGEILDAGGLNDVRPALERFFRWLETTNAVVQDLHEDNLVLADRNGVPEIVIIDGFGDRAAITLRTYFPSLNRRRTRYYIKRFQQKLETRPPRRALKKQINRQSGTV